MAVAGAHGILRLRPGQTAQLCDGAALFGARRAIRWLEATANNGDPRAGDNWLIDSLDVAARLLDKLAPECVWVGIGWVFTYLARLTDTETAYSEALRLATIVGVVLFSGLVFLCVGAVARGGWVAL